MSGIEISVETLLKSVEAQRDSLLADWARLQIHVQVLSGRVAELQAEVASLRNDGNVSAGNLPTSEG